MQKMKFCSRFLTTNEKPNYNLCFQSFQKQSHRMENACSRQQNHELWYILGTDILEHLGIIINFKEKQITWEIYIFLWEQMMCNIIAEATARTTSVRCPLWGCRFSPNDGYLSKSRWHTKTTTLASFDWIQTALGWYIRYLERPTNKYWNKRRSKTLSWQVFSNSKIQGRNKLLVSVKLEYWE